MKKRLLASLLCGAMTVSLLPMTAFAEEQLVVQDVQVQADMQEAISGKCGDQLTWKVDVVNGEKVLTISGTGKMYDFDYRGEDVPWSVDIKKVIIQNGAESIGEDAFQSTMIRSIDIADSVSQIGKGAFIKCRDLEKIRIPNNVTTLDGQFYGCSGLVSIEIPKAVTKITGATFYGCSSLKDVYYGSSEGDWNRIDIDWNSNDELKAATIHYEAFDEGLTDEQKEVKNLLDRCDGRTPIVWQYTDPNDIVLDYFNNKDLAKMTVTMTGKHLSSNAMWQEAYRRTLTEMSGSKGWQGFQSRVEFVSSIYSEFSDITDETLRVAGVTVDPTMLAGITAAAKDSVEQLGSDLYLLGEIAEETSNPNLKEACEQIAQQKMVSFNVELEKIIAEKVFDLGAEELGRIAKEISSEVLGKAASVFSVFSYVQTVLFVKDLVTDINGWADLTEAYQDSICYANIATALASAYQRECEKYRAGDDDILYELGHLYQGIEAATKYSYEDMETVLGKKYNKVLDSDPYLKQRVKEVEDLSMETYQIGRAKKMKPTAFASRQTLSKKKKSQKKSQIKLRKLRYGVRVEYKVTSGKKYIKVNSKGEVTAKKKGSGTVTVTIHQNGGTYNSDIRYRVKA